MRPFSPSSWITAATDLPWLKSHGNYNRNPTPTFQLVPSLAVVFPPLPAAGLGKAVTVFPLGPVCLWSSTCDISSPCILAGNTLSCSRLSQGVHPTSFAGPVCAEHERPLRKVFSLNPFKTLYGKSKVGKSTLSNIVCMRLS